MSELTERAGTGRSLTVPAQLDRPQVSDHQRLTERREFRMGLAGTLFVVALLVATGIVYAVPWSSTTYTANLSEAQSVRVGDDVRVAGINVGTVDALELGDTQVEMRFSVNDDVFMGSETTIDIRMLTVVGGHYLAVFPAGDTPLGDNAIPVDRVTQPYSLLQTLQDAAAPVSKVDGTALRMNMEVLDRSLAESPESLRNIGRAAQSLVEVLNKQNDDVSKALAVAQEYLSTIDANKGLLGDFVRRLGKLTGKLVDNRDQVRVALTATGEMLYRLGALEPLSRSYLEPVLDTLTENGPGLQELLTKYDQLIGSVQDTMTKLQQSVVGPDGPVLDLSAITLSASTICVPIPGREC